MNSLIIFSCNVRIDHFEVSRIMSHIFELIHVIKFLHNPQSIF